jgi:flagellar assembly factor FliW
MIGTLGGTVSAQSISIQTTRFGDLTVREDEIVVFPEGILGFAGQTRFVLFPNPTGGPLYWLQSAEDGSLAFIVCKPTLFKPDYKISVHPKDLEGLELERLEDGEVFAIMVVPPDNPRGMTANLQGPLIVNAKRRLAKQVVLVNADYGTKYRVFRD